MDGIDIVVYSTPNCKYCKEAKEFLADQGFYYEEYNVAEDSEARSEMIELSGQLGVPVLTINGTVFVGFDAQAVNDELDRLTDGDLPFDDEDNI
jgi:glutaredoxin-like YruB-family protein